MKVHVYRLPDLARQASFQLEGEAVDAAVGRAAIAVVATDADRRVIASRSGRTWAEGWSLESGSRAWGPLLLSDRGVRDDGGLLQGDSDSCVVSQGGLVTRLGIADGAIRWQSAPDGRLVRAGERIAVAADGSSGLRGLALLDGGDGHLLAHHLSDRGPFRDVVASGQELIAVDLQDTVHVFPVP